MKIAIIEDNRILSGVLHDEFSDAGFDVVRAYNGEEGFALVQTEKPDLIVLDIMMPKINGIDLLKILKADDSLKDIPVFVLTASANEDRLQEAFDYGADDAMLKSRHTLGGIVDRIKNYQKVK